MNEQHRVAVLVRSQKHVWQSCNTIQANLLESYKKTSHDCHFFYYDDHQNLNEDLQLAANLRRFDPQVIAFVSNADPYPVFQILRKSLPNLNQRRLIFHLYGDFLLNIRHWKQLSPWLHGHQVLFLAASEAQKKVCAEFFENPTSVQILPFSVNSSLFKFDPDLRSRWRAHLNIDPTEKVILYAGRISLQKNVDILLKALQGFNDISRKQNMHFFCAGDFDHLGAPFLKLSVTRDQIKNNIGRLLELNHPMKSSLLGHVQQEQLPSYYNAADIFVSLSTHHDEDFGMSAAEALMCGTKTLLSQWGGYKSFSAVAENCKSVAVSKDIAGPGLNLDEITGALQHQLSTEDSTSERQRRSELFQRHYSVEAVALLLNEFIPARENTYRDISSDWDVEHCFTGSTGQFLKEKYWRYYDHYV